MRLKRVLKKMMFNKKVKKISVPILIGNLLKDKIVLIVGGTSGIGNAIAKIFLDNGATVIISGRNKKNLIDTKNKLINSGYKEENIFIHEMNVCIVNKINENINSIEKMINNRKIDIVIDSAGVSGGNIIGATVEKDYDQILNTNLKGTYFLLQEISNYFIKNNIEGKIIVISSVSGQRPAISPYMISKWGINGLIKGLAKKYAEKNIIINGIAPGPTITNMIKHEKENLYYDKSPVKRFCDPIEIANLALFLASDFSKMIIGEIINISGGCGTLTFDDIEY